jgi:hypothetical protein
MSRTFAHRRLVSLIVLISVCLFGSSYHSSMAQAPFAQPPVVRVELQGVEPTPGSVAGLLSFSFEQGQNYRDDFYTAPNWVYTRDASYPGQTELIACGFNNTPTGLLIMPNGQQQTVALDFANWGSASGCFKYALNWALGTPFGTYKLVMAGDNGIVERSWQLGYPDFPTTLYTAPNEEIVLMGFRARQTVSVHFYGYNVGPNGENSGSTADGLYWATRQVQVDQYGALVLKLELGRTAPFANLKYIVAGYPYAHYSWRRYDDWRRINNYSTPDAMIREYYDAINKRWYDMAWDNLSTHYKTKYNARPGGGYDFEPFKDWWNSVEKVDVEEATFVGQDGALATVFTRYRFTMRNGRQSQGTVNYIVTFSPTEQRWLFYDQN